MIARKLPFLLLPALAALILFLQADLDRVKDKRAGQLRGAFVPPRPEVLKAFLLGYHTVVADLYWLDAIQYFSETVTRKVPPEDLYPMTDFITDLDPRFCVTYYFSGLNMAVGDADPRKAAMLLDKGRANCKDYWKVSFVAGYVYYFLLHDEGRAADAMDDAARLKPFPPWALLASRMRAEAGNYELSISILSQMMDNVGDPAQKRQFAERIAVLRVKIKERDLTALGKEYERRTGHAPASVQDLIRAGLLRDPPAHLMRGHRYLYDPAIPGFRSEPPVETPVYIPPQLRKPEQAEE